MVSGPPVLPEGLTFESREGMLTTRSSSKKRVSWKPRWFALSADALRWYTHRNDGTVPQLRGFLKLQSVTLTTELDPRELKAMSVPKHGSLLCFKIETRSGNPPPLFVHTADFGEKQRWVSALERNIYLASNPRGGVYASNGFQQLMLPGAAPAPAPSAAGSRCVSSALGDGVLGGDAVATQRRRAQTALPNPSAFAALAAAERASRSSSATPAAGDDAGDDGVGGRGGRDGGSGSGSCCGDAEGPKGDACESRHSASEPTRWGAKRGFFPPPPPPKQAKSDSEAINRSRRAATTAAATGRGVVHAFRPWVVGWVPRRSSARDSPSGRASHGSFGRSKRKGGGGGPTGGDVDGESAPRSPGSPAGRSDGEGSWRAESSSSSEDDVDGVAEATSSWVRRRQQAMRQRAQTIGSFFSSSSSFSRSSSNRSRQSQQEDGDGGGGDAAPADVRLSPQKPALARSDDIVDQLHSLAVAAAGPSKWPSGRQRAATTASAEATAAVAQTGGVRDRAQLFERRPPVPHVVPPADPIAAAARAPAPAGSPATAEPAASGQQSGTRSRSKSSLQSTPL
jgi:hypothetical protein